MARGGDAADARNSGDDDASEPETEDYASPERSRAVLLGRERKRPSSTLSDESDGADSAGEEYTQQLAKAASFWRVDDLPHRPDDTDAKLTSTRRYLRASRALYEIQYQLKRPSAILKTKSSSYGFKPSSTYDALAALLSPLRARQVLDNWTALEIAVFEEAFDRFGKNFHAIAEQLPKKSAGDAIALYYVWKKHGSHAKPKLPEGNRSPSDDYFGLTGPDVSNETLTLLDRLKKRQLCMQDYFDAARSLCPSRPSSQGPDRKRLKAMELYGLQRLPHTHRAITGLSPLKSHSVLDSWTPFEIRVFEVAIECYGKEFHRIAEAIGSKTCRDVVAFYYVWKKDSYYQLVKNRWEKRNEATQLIKKST